MNVAAIIVTRGDVDLQPVLSSLPEEWEVGVWNNGDGLLAFPSQRRWGGAMRGYPVEDLSVYGRYAAIECTDAELIYVQDDDCVVSDPATLVREWNRVWREGIQGKAGVLNFHSTGTEAHVVCNMPPEFRHDFYEDHALVGFGAVFHRDAPARAFEKFWGLTLEEQVETYSGSPNDFFNRTCDIAFTGLTPRVLVDVPKENLPWANAPNRMWMQPTHQAERARMLEIVKKKVSLAV